jgi:imidazole glycerol-phosphate synthase subunit HisH
LTADEFTRVGASTAGPAGPMIGIADYGMGNRRSVEKALVRIGARPVLSSDHETLRRTDGLIVPGVGAFRQAMLRLDELGLDDLIREQVAAGVPTLGICLGMQLAFEHSTELGGADGLGIVPGVVRELAAGDLKVPHIGWSAVNWRPASPPACPTRGRTKAQGALVEGLPDGSTFYHVHSFVTDPTDPADPLGSAEHGERFVTAVGRGSFFGVQFHPEKSSTAGLRLLANFAGICAAGAVGPAELRPASAASGLRPASAA